MTDPSGPVFSDGFTPAQPGETPGTVIPDDAQPQPIDVANFAFVRLPDGTVHAVPNSAIHDVAAPDIATAVSEAPKTATAPAREEHFYVHLANGDVRRVKESDLPPSAGSNAPHGFWQESGKVFLVIGVHPVETEI